MGNQIKIVAEPQLEFDKCKFILEKPVIAEGSFYFYNADEAKGSSIAEGIFKVAHVAEVFVAKNTILVKADSREANWREIGKEVGQAIRRALQNDQPLIGEEFKKKIPSEDEIRKKAQEVLISEINPSVAMHGGQIDLLDVKYNDVYVKMGGGCQGCAQSTATLKQGVELAFRKVIPYVGSIYDTTDHASGTNPYYQM